MLQLINHSLNVINHNFERYYPLNVTKHVFELR